jgi:hypothetical protein
MAHSEAKNGPSPAQVRAKWPKDPNRARTGRSRVTNGATFLTLRAGGLPSARRLRDLMALFTSDMGGMELCSTAELMLIRRASTLVLQLELMEESWAADGGRAPPKRLNDYQKVTNSLRRVLEALGLKRRMRDVTPTVDEYLASQGYKRGEQEDVDGAAD